MDGYTKYLLSLAFDVYSLQLKNHLPEYLLERLKNRNEFQGVRYEIAVAAIFTRIGYEIEFLDKEKKKNKHCDFIAINKNLNLMIAVEAKSRHRRGIIHESGERPEEKKLLKGDIHSLINTALKQNPNTMPFVIFVDLNSPQTLNPDINQKPYMSNIKKMLDSTESDTPIFVTNFSYHYQEASNAGPTEYLIMMPFFKKSLMPQILSVGDPNFYEKMRVEIEKYGNIPNLK